MRKVHSVIAVAALLAISCSKSEDVPCQPGYALCGATCVRSAVDRQNCGACGRTCGETEACVAGACIPDCRASLNDPIDNPWGASWDGLERPNATYTAARDACEAIGARLPTASEIVRAGKKSGSIGDTYKTNLLWSAAPIDAANGLAVRLSDGASALLAFSPADPKPHYRCVCPPPPPAAFAGSACYTSQSGDGCAALGDDPSFNFDAENRTALPHSAAMYECALAGAEPPTAERLAAAFIGGLPNTTSEILHTADALNVAGWAAGAKAGTPVTFATSSVSTDWLPFRCFGPSAPGIAPGDRERVPRAARRAGGERRAGLRRDGLRRGGCGLLQRGGPLPTGSELRRVRHPGPPRGRPDDGAVDLRPDGDHDGRDLRLERRVVLAGRSGPRADRGDPERRHLRLDDGGALGEDRDPPVPVRLLRRQSVVHGAVAQRLRLRRMRRDRRRRRPRPGCGSRTTITAPPPTPTWTRSGTAPRAAAGCRPSGTTSRRSAPGSPATGTCCSPRTS